MPRRRVHWWDDWKEEENSAEEKGYEEVKSNYVDAKAGEDELEEI